LLNDWLVGWLAAGWLASFIGFFFCVFSQSVCVACQHAGMLACCAVVLARLLAG